jgi:hypothetical protein
MAKKILQSPKEFFVLAGIELNKAVEQRLKVAKEGRTAQWELEQYGEIKSKFTREANKIADAMMETAKAERDKFAMEHRVIRNRPHSPLRPKDGSQMVYHQSRANNMFEGLSEEEAIKEFSFAVSILNDDEKPYLHIYEDSLMFRMKDPAYKNAAKDEIFKHKSTKEKIAFMLAERAEMEFKELETLAALIRHDIEKVASGEKIPTYNYFDIFEEVGGYDEPQITELKINPYEGDTEPDNGESE